MRNCESCALSMSRIFTCFQMSCLCRYTNGCRARRPGQLEADGLKVFRARAGSLRRGSAAPDVGLVAAIANVLRLLLLQEALVGVAIRRVSGMAIHTGGGVSVKRLPAGQEGVEVAVEIGRRRHIGVTLQTIGVADRHRERRRLLVCVDHKRCQVARPQRHGANPAAEAGARVAVDAARGPGGLVF